MNNRDINEIIPHLYISNWETSNNPEILNRYKIKAVITLETTNKPPQILKYYKDNGIEFLYISLFDNQNSDIYRYFDETYNFIKKHRLNNENTLVHCAAGISRSATIILNFMITTMFENSFLKNENPDDIINYVLNIARSRRSIINPNRGFLNQLKDKIKDYQHYQ